MFFCVRYFPGFPPSFGESQKTAEFQGVSGTGPVFTHENSGLACAEEPCSNVLGVFWPTRAWKRVTYYYCFIKKRDRHRVQGCAVRCAGSVQMDVQHI